MLCNCKSGHMTPLSLFRPPRGLAELCLLSTSHAGQDYGAISQEQSNEKQENRTRATAHRSLSVCSICLRSRCTPDPCRVRCLVPPPLFALLAARKTDRPQSDFTEALTPDPSLTPVWISAGLALVEVWWASWMRSGLSRRPPRGLRSKSNSTARGSMVYASRCADASDAEVDHVDSFDVRSEIQGSDCAHLVCCITNARRRRRLWCPRHNVSLFVLIFGSLS